MTKISQSELLKEIHAILEHADLEQTSSKKVRKELETKLGVDLLSRKKEIDSAIMDYINSRDKDEEAEGEDDAEEENAESEEEAEEKAPAKRKAPKRAAAPAKKTPAKKKKANTSADDESDEKNDASDAEEDTPRNKPRKGKKVTKPKAKVAAANDNSDSDENLEEVKKSAAKKKGGNSGYTRPYTLSPMLAELMGAESMPRHEVVRKVWQIVRERNLSDPKNKQYSICDPELQKIMGVKRFRTFGMLKYLKNHFID